MPEAAQGGNGGGWFQSILQTVAIFFLVNTFTKWVTGAIGEKSAESTPSNGTTVPVVRAVATPLPAFSDRPSADGIDSYNAVPQWIHPIWPSNATLDITIYVSSSPFPQPLGNVDQEDVVLQEKDFRFSAWNDTRDIHTTFSVPKDVQNNGTLWAHFFVAQSGWPLDPKMPNYDQSKAHQFARPMTQYIPKKKVAKTRNLLSDTVEVDEEETGEKIIANYYHSNYTISVIPDSGMQSYAQMHAAVRAWVNLESTGARDRSGQNGWYYPIVYLNTFWQLRSHMTELNTTVTRLPINIHLNSQSNWKFSLLTSMDFGVKVNQEKVAQGGTLPGGGDGSELEVFKQILFDSNPYLLATTAIVAVFHTLFEFLAFKNDVSHFRNKKNNVGISVRTILANVIMQIIIFLYLFDNNENTSWMILMGQGVGIVIEAWKITKTVDVRMRPTPADSTQFPWRYLPYTVTFEDKHKLSDTEVKTQEYDQIAFKYMYWVAVPLLAAYAVYSLLYSSHKSWYSFVITTLVGSVYAYGFLLMVPSLYINYRLQSVAHMPGRAMAYKFLNTFIDDLFAFTIKMPLLHRLATLRDDVIFFVYLYQCWKYKVDHNRVNEFGQGGDDETDSKVAEAEEPQKAVVEIADAKAATTTATSESKANGVAKKRK